MKNKYVQVFGKLCVYTTLLFGLLISLRSGLWYGIKAGILFGIATSVAIFIIYTISNLLSKNKLPSEALNIVQKRTYQLHGNSEAIYAQCFNVLAVMNFIKKNSIQKDEMIISAKTKSSWASLGENIEIEIHPIQSNITELHIISHPSFRTTVFDWGKNYKNVEQILKTIQDSCGHDVL